jgi:hypothetical protein
MSFQSRQEAYSWSESLKPQGPCGVVVVNGGFRHLFLLERDHDRLDLVYVGMRRR